MWMMWCLKIEHNTGASLLADFCIAVKDLCWQGIPGRTSPTLFEQWCGFFYVPQEPDKCKYCESGPTVFRPYQRRLESLTVCKCHYKGSTFFSVIKRPWVLVRPGFEPVTSRSADRRSPNWANQSAYSLSQVPTLLTHSAGAGAKVLHVRILLSQGIPTTVLAYPRFLYS